MKLTFGTTRYRVNVLFTYFFSIVIKSDCATHNARIQSMCLLLLLTIYMYSRFKVGFCDNSFWASLWLQISANGLYKFGSFSVEWHLSRVVIALNSTKQCAK